MKHEFHNPANLTPEQVGEGYRLLLKSEITEREKRPEIHICNGSSWLQDEVGFYGNLRQFTYRVPLATWPLPEPEKPTTNDPQDEFAPTDNDSWNSLLATNAKLGKEVAELKRSRDKVSDYQDELEAKLKAAESRLAELEWVPFTERRPTQEDADYDDCVTITDGKICLCQHWNEDRHPTATHWRPFGFKRADLFEEWFKDFGLSPQVSKTIARQIFNAGRDMK